MSGNYSSHGGMMKMVQAMQAAMRDDEDVSVNASSHEVIMKMS